MIRAILRKIESSHTNLRTNEMEGVITNLPVIGQPLIIMNDTPLDNKDADGRSIITTPIVTMDMSECGTSYLFATVNSTYELEILGDEDDSSS